MYQRLFSQHLITRLCRYRVSLNILVHTTFGARRTVIDAISKLDGSRKCFRLIGGVLVERTIADVLPAVQKNLEGVRAANVCPVSSVTTAL